MLICRFFTLILLIGFLTGCAGIGSRRLAPPPPLSSQQRAAMQTKELNGDFDIAFSATISVLQDEGWQIEVVDKPSGIIQATSLKRQDYLGPAEDWYAEQDSKYREKIIKKAEKDGYGVPEWTRWEQITAHLEQWRKDSVRHRITITKYGSLPSNIYDFSKKKSKEKIVTAGGKEQSLVVENPTPYQYLFQQIQHAIFIREGLGGRH